MSIFTFCNDVFLINQNSKTKLKMMKRLLIVIIAITINLFCVDKYNGTVFAANPPAAEDEMISKLKSLVFLGNKIKSVSIQGDSWCIVANKNDFYHSNIPVNMKNKLAEYKRKGYNVKQAILHKNNGWLLIQGKNGYWYSGVPKLLKEKIKKLNNTYKEINHVSLAHDDSWVVIEGKNKYHYKGIPFEFTEKLKEFKKNDKKIKIVTFNKKRGGVIVYGGNGYFYDKITPTLKAKLKEVNKNRKTINNLLIYGYNNSVMVHAPKKVWSSSKGDLNKSSEKSLFVSKLPPILSIDEISFSEDVLDAMETGTLKVRIKNSGPGDAKNVKVRLECDKHDVKFFRTSTIPKIASGGNFYNLSIKVTGGDNLKTDFARLKITVEENNFNIKVKGKQLLIPTRAFKAPNMIIAKYALTEYQSATMNGQVDVNEMIDLKFVVQNIGEGDAEDVKVKVANKQKGVMLLGVVKNEQMKRREPVFPMIEVGKYKTIVYRYFVNSEFTESNLKFEFSINEKYGKNKFLEHKLFPVNTELKEQGYIRTVAHKKEEKKRKIVIEDIPDLVVDVDVNIPKTYSKKNNTYALIIGNEDYHSKQTGLSSEQNVDFAENDARMFAAYCNKTLGVPSKQIKTILNATSAEMKQGLAWIKNLAKIEDGNAEIIFYYSGHGLPHEQTKEAYLIPVDVSGGNLEFAVKLKDAYAELSAYPTKKTTVFLDACFSGGARNKGLLALKGVKVRPKKQSVKNNMIVMSSSTGDESSAVYNEKKHGYFTYFLLKKLQETKGDISYKELSDFIIKNVKKETGLKGKIQSPQINISPQVKGKWEYWKVK